MNDARRMGSGKADPVVVVRSRPRVSPRERRLSLVSLSRDGMHVPVSRDEDILAAREKGQALALQLGFTSSDATLIAFVISELTRDILLYAKHGEIVLSVLQQQGKSGLMVTARHKGPGAPSMDESAEQRLPELGGLVDELIVASKEGYGTTVTVKKWKPEGI